jgi:hypothetical protein
MGISYTITSTGPMEVAVKVNSKKLAVQASIQQMEEGWIRWTVQGNMVQDAFPFLSSGEREFLMTGITDDEWDQLFKDGNK